MKMKFLIDGYGHLEVVEEVLSWLCYFEKGEGSKLDCIMEAFLAYWLSWYVLPSILKDELHPFVFLLSIQIAKGQACLGGSILGLLVRKIGEVRSKHSLGMLGVTTW